MDRHQEVISATMQLMNRIYDTYTSHRMLSDAKFNSMGVRFKHALADAIGPQGIIECTEKLIGQNLFSLSAPTPQQLLEVYALQKKHPAFSLACDVDEKLISSYHSLCPKEVPLRIARVKQLLGIVSDLQASDDEMLRLLTWIDQTGSKGGYPPTMTCIRSKLIRDRVGVGTLEEELVAYLAGTKTSFNACFQRLCGPSSIRLMTTDVLQRVMGKIYAGLEEKDWADLLQIDSSASLIAKDQDAEQDSIATTVHTLDAIKGITDAL